jgi:hypothetical protein
VTLLARGNCRPLDLSGGRSIGGEARVDSIVRTPQPQARRHVIGRVGAALFHPHFLKNKKINQETFRKRLGNIQEHSENVREHSVNIQ